MTTIASATGQRVDINYTQEPTTYTEATSTYSCGNETALTLTAITNHPTSGREVKTPAITDGDTTANQTAGWWSLTNASDTLHAAGALSAAQAVTSGNKFTLGAISVAIRGATAA
ncbi:MAG: hypothetical protein PVI43_00160 [Candidatus Bathyarchaeota archaeon]